MAIVVGSDSDLPVMQGARDALDALGVDYDLAIVSAHRTPERMADFAGAAAGRGLSVIIAGAGGAAHLPGMVAAHTTLPVIGVPVPVGHLQGTDALLSIVQMPTGVPVAAVAIGGAFNAGLLAAPGIPRRPDQARRRARRAPRRLQGRAAPEGPRQKI